MQFANFFLETMSNADQRLFCFNKFLWCGTARTRISFVRNAVLSKYQWRGIIFYSMPIPSLHMQMQFTILNVNKIQRWPKLQRRAWISKFILALFLLGRYNLISGGQFNVIHRMDDLVCGVQNKGSPRVDKTTFMKHHSYSYECNYHHVLLPYPIFFVLLTYN